MTDESKENVHKDHRSRMKERVRRSGLSDFAPHEVLEVVLYYAIPQKDTNPLAHRLLSQFGSVYGVLSAPEEELRKVPGIGDHAAFLLHLLLPVAAYTMAHQDVDKATAYSDVSTVGQYLVNRYMGVTQETVCVMLLNNRYELIDCVDVFQGSVNSVGITPRMIIELAYRKDASMVILAHNHPGGVPIPSRDDVQTTASLRQALSIAGVRLLEHFIIAGNRYGTMISKAPALQNDAPDSPDGENGYTMRAGDCEWL